MFGQPDDGPFRYTEAEAALVARLAQVKVRADGGDRKAKKQIAKVLKQLAALQKRARRGDMRAARAAQVLEESGLLAPSQTFAMEGLGASPWTWQLGGINVLNAGLIVTMGVLLVKKRWGWATVPAGVLAFREGRQKGWW